MDTIAKADIFFIVTTIAVLVILAIILVAGFYVLQTLKNIREISELIKKAATGFSGDLNAFRDVFLEKIPFGKLIKKKVDRVSSKKVSERK